MRGALNPNVTQNKGRRGVFSCLFSWWRKRHQHYLSKDDTREEESVLSDVPSYLPPPTHPGILRHYQPRDDESSQGSLESMDSLMNSYWDPDETSSMVIVHNEPQELVMNAHVNFLRHSVPEPATT